MRFVFNKDTQKCEFSLWCWWQYKKKDRGGVLRSVVLGNFVERKTGFELGFEISASVPRLFISSPALHRREEKVLGRTPFSAIVREAV